MTIVIGQNSPHPGVLTSGYPGRSGCGHDRTNRSGEGQLVSRKAGVGEIIPDIITSHTDQMVSHLGREGMEKGHKEANLSGDLRRGNINSGPSGNRSEH